MIKKVNVGALFQLKKEWLQVAHASGQFKKNKSSRLLNTFSVRVTNVRQNSALKTAF